jgi:hypothetical protein
MLLIVIRRCAADAALIAEETPDSCYVHQQLDIRSEAPGPQTLGPFLPARGQPLVHDSGKSRIGLHNIIVYHAGPRSPASA